MDMKLMMGTKTNYLLITSKAPPALEEFLPRMKKIHEQCELHNTCRVIVDARQWTSAPPLIHTFQGGEMFADVFGSKIQFAFVTKDLKKEQLFAEDVIFNRGGNFKIFTNFDEALQWLGAT